MGAGFVKSVAGTYHQFGAVALLVSLSLVAGLPTCALASAADGEVTAASDWPAYGGSKGSTRYSSLRQINRDNVGQLKEAWRFDAGVDGALQTNPLVIGGKLFGYTSTQTVFALDAASGRKLWAFTPPSPGRQPARGLSYWTDGKRSILFAGALSFLYALDPATGKPVVEFGDGGHIDLRNDLDEADAAKGFAALTSPGVVYRDMIIVGFRAPETHPALRGDIRAYDVHSGKLRWIFHTIPRPGEAGYETWPKEGWRSAGAANSWAGMALDEQRGILYVPTGSAVDDFYGADRLGDDLYANSLLALDANTGKRLWHFQGVHHDIWDRDFPSPPTMVTVRANGKKVDAVAQTSKQGFLFLFDRVTGKPLFPITERPFPASDVPGEQASPTQPIPSLPAPYARQILTAEMLTTRTPEAHANAVEQFKRFRSEGQFVPLSVGKQTVVFPGFDGGAEWGGSAFDPKTGVLYVNANDIPWTGGLAENRAGGGLGSSVYMSQCALCHGGDRKGAPPEFPTLIDIQKRLTDAQIAEVIASGKGRMPSFPNVEAGRLTALLEYLKTGEGDAGAVHTTVKYGDRSQTAGAAVYDRNCALCHGEGLQGAPSNYPGLLGVRERLSDAQIATIVHDGKGRMPALRGIGDADMGELLRFLNKSAMPLVEASSKHEVESGAAAGVGEPRYRFTGYRKFQDPEGYPAVKPPWGTLNAIDLNTGAYLWKVPLGEYPELAAKGLKDTGTENYGGPVVTAGGIVVIGATIFDSKIRAFDSKTGKLLWTGQLPFAGNATPATYMVAGKQYIVIATSGERNVRGPQGAAYVAFALP